MKGGHNEARANAIIAEAKNSSNPAYILNYWGLTIKQAEEYANHLKDINIF